MQVDLGIFSLMCRCGPVSSAPNPAGSVRSCLGLEMPGTERDNLWAWMNGEHWGPSRVARRRALSAKGTREALETAEDVRSV